jgi:hypothetical protein
VRPAAGIEPTHTDGRAVARGNRISPVPGAGLATSRPAGLGSDPPDGTGASSPTLTWAPILTMRRSPGVPAPLRLNAGRNVRVLVWAGGGIHGCRPRLVRAGRARLPSCHQGSLARLGWPSGGSRQAVAATAWSAPRRG